MINFPRLPIFPEVIYLNPVGKLQRNYFHLWLLNPNLPNVGRIIKKHLHILDSKPKIKELFPPNSIIPSFRRSKNLKQLLAPSCNRTTSEVETIVIKGCLKCQRSGCDLCANFFVEFKSFLLVSKQAKSIPFSQNCLVIQKMLSIWPLAKKCPLQYVGSTTTDFRVWFCNHKSAMVTNKKTSEVAVHFNILQSQVCYGHQQENLWGSGAF